MRTRSALAFILCVMLAHGAGTVSAFNASDRASTREITLPAGTRLPVVLDTPVASNTSRVEQSVAGHVSRDVAVNGVVVVPAGSEVLGVVTSARQSGKMKGRAYIGIRFLTLVPKGSAERYRIQTAAIGRLGPGRTKENTIKIGAPAAGGALIGALVGGKKGALIGTGVGAGAGTAVAATTRGEEVGIARGTSLILRLGSPVAVRVRM
jgi:hypothetical protein